MKYEAPTKTTNPAPSASSNVFTPLDWQIAPWKDRSATVLCTGSAGGGKSRLAMEKIHGYAMRYPRSTCLIIRKTRDSLLNSVILPFESSILGPQAAGRIVHKQNKSRFDYPNGSVIIYGGMRDEQQAQKVRSVGIESGIDYVWIEEANELWESDFDELLGRLRGTAAPWRQVFLTCNPDSPQHWIYLRLIKGGEANVYYSHARQNPNVADDYIDTLSRLRGVKGERLREGRWVQAEGTIYDVFDPAVHVVDWFKPPPLWRRWISVDFGYRNPFVAQWWAVNHDDQAFLYHEIYKTQTLVEDHARAIARYVHEHNETIDDIICDHDAEGRATLEKYLKRPTVPARKAIMDGIEAVIGQMTPDKNNHVGLFYMRIPGDHMRIDKSLKAANKPTCSLDEITLYRWRVAATGRIMKELPEDENNHGMDTKRYFVMHRHSPKPKWFRRSPGYAYGTS